MRYQFDSLAHIATAHGFAFERTHRFNREERYVLFSNELAPGIEGYYATLAEAWVDISQLDHGRNPLTSTPLPNAGQVATGGIVPRNPLSPLPLPTGAGWKEIIDFNEAQDEQDSLAMRAAKNICHDLHEGHVPGTTGKNLFPMVDLHCQDMESARKHIAAIIQLEINSTSVHWKS